MSTKNINTALRLTPKNGLSPSALIIVLHGVGSRPYAMADVAMALSAEFPKAAVVVPAGSEPFDMGGEGRQWFSIVGISEANRPGRVKEALLRLDQLIDAEAAEAGLSRQVVALVGFSQGGIMALHVAATSAPVGAVATLSGRLAGQVWAGPGKRPPVLLSHGTADLRIPVEQQLMAAISLRKLGCSVTLQTLDGHGHGIVPAQFEAISQHIRKNIDIT